MQKLWCFMTLPMYECAAQDYIVCAICVCV